MPFPVLVCGGPLPSVGPHAGHGTAFSGGQECAPDTSTPSLPQVLREERDMAEDTVRVGLKRAPSARHWRWSRRRVPVWPDGRPQAVLHTPTSQRSLPHGCARGREPLPRPVCCRGGGLRPGKGLALGLVVIPGHSNQLAFLRCPRPPAGGLMVERASYPRQRLDGYRRCLFFFSATHHASPQGRRAHTKEASSMAERSGL